MKLGFVDIYLHADGSICIYHYPNKKNKNLNITYNSYSPNHGKPPNHPIYYCKCKLRAFANPELKIDEENLNGTA